LAASVIGCAWLAEKTRTMQNQAAELKVGDAALAAQGAD
jgi:hypothetical protein